MSDRQERVAKMLEMVLRLPRTHQEVIPAEYVDMNGHMNISYYTIMGNNGLDKFFGLLGFSRGEMLGAERSTFALRQVLNYLNEVRQDEEIAVHSGLYAYDHKRLHFVHYVVSLTHNRLCSSDERLAISVDMKTRRTTDFRPEALAQLAKALEYYQSFGWQPELSGAISLK